MKFIVQSKEPAKFTSRELATLILRGDIDQNSLVRHTGVNSWSRLIEMLGRDVVAWANEQLKPPAKPDPEPPAPAPIAKPVAMPAKSTKDVRGIASTILGVIALAFGSAMFIPLHVYGVTDEYLIRWFLTFAFAAWLVKR